MTVINPFWNLLTFNTSPAKQDDGGLRNYFLELIWLYRMLSLLGNGGIFQNGVSSNPNGNGTVANERIQNAVERAGNYATLPHPHHHLQNIHVSLIVLFAFLARKNEVKKL